jgi:hypothetical protein
MTTTTKPRPKRVTEETVCHALARCLAKRPNAATPDEDDVRELTYWINRYIGQPWDQAAIRRYRNRDRRVRQNRKTLNAASAVLRAELDNWRSYEASDERWLASYAQQEIAVYETAISVLERPRDLECLPRTSNNGPDPKPWVLVAMKLGQETLAALHKAQHRADHRLQRTAGDRDGVIISSVAMWLKLIYGPANVPSHDTILSAIAKNVGNGCKSR